MKISVTLLDVVHSFLRCWEGVVRINNHVMFSYFKMNKNRLQFTMLYNTEFSPQPWEYPLQILICSIN